MQNSWGKRAWRLFAHQSISSLSDEIGSPSWDDVVVCLELADLPASIYYRVFEEPLDGSSLIAWAVRRLRNVTGPSVEICVLCHGADGCRARSALGERSAGVTVLSSGEIADFIQAFPRERILLLSMAATLLPNEVFQAFRNQHIAQANDATHLIGTPLATSPLLVESELVSLALQRWKYISDLRAGIVALSRGHGLRKRVRVGSFSPHPQQVTRREKWPLSLRLDRSEDADVLRRVVKKHEDNRVDSAGVDLLAAWPASVARARGIRPNTVSIVGEDRPKLLFAQNPSAFSGVEQVLLSLCAGISSKYACSALVGLSGTFADRLALEGVNVRIANREFSANNVGNYKFCHSELKDIEPHVINAHSVVGVPFCCAVAERGIPFVQYVHVASDQALLQLEDQLSFATAIVAVSEFVKFRIARLGFDAAHIHVIRYGVPQRPSSRRRSAEQTRALIPSIARLPVNAKIVLMVARFAANKRHDVALEAFARLRTWVANVYLLVAGEVFYGDRPVFERFMRRVEQLGLKDRVLLLGFCGDMRSLYESADVLILPSENDPLPITIVEAMAFGVPVIAARSGGIPEIIEDGVSGILAEKGDTEAFANGLHQLLIDGDLRRNLVTSGRVVCQRKFDQGRFAAEVSMLFERFIA